MTLTVTPVSTGLPPRVALSYVGAANAVTATVSRLDPDNTWRPVRAAEPATLEGGTWAGSDYEMPYGAPFQYKIVPNVGTTEVVSCLVDPYDLEGNPATWLIHPGVPALSIRIERSVTLPDFYGVMLNDTQGDVVLDANRAVLRPFGSPFAVAIADGTRWQPSRAITLKSFTPVAVNRLVAIFNSMQTLLLNPHPKRNHNFARAYISVGTVTHTGAGRAFPTRVWQMPYDTTLRPIGGYLSQWTWSDVESAYATWNDVTQVFPSWNALVANTPTPIP